MPNVVQSLFHDLSSPGTNPPSWAVSERVWLCLFMAILIPLCFLRKLDSLRHTSYVALFTVGKRHQFGMVLLISISFSISHYNRHCLLLQPSRRYFSEGGSISCTLHNWIHYNIPCAGLWIYLCSECRCLHQGQPVRANGIVIAISDLQRAQGEYPT